MPEPTSEDRSLNLRKFLIQPEALRLVPEPVARQYTVIPLEVVNNVLKVAMANPNDILALEALAAKSQMRIDPRTATAEEIREAIDFNYRSYQEIAEEISRISLPGETTKERIAADIGAVTDAPVVKALALIMDEAVKARASDIHLQPQDNELRVRFRVDGTLHDMFTLPLGTAIPLISRIKVMANMNIADHLRPQDGQFSIQPKGRRDRMDIRVGIIPTVYGEMAALRLLDKARAFVPLSQLGFLPESLAKYEEMLKVPYGMVLVSGPTGSGKTTTLYASINTLDCKERNIITIEDPVEYRFRYINQIQTNARAGLTFASGLRSILRLDPNVILVGEIRDAETANIAVQAALTGHLVLSSIHANDAIGIVSRLLDLGVERFLIASAVIGVVAQRMGRRVCPDCAGLVEVPLVERAVYSRETGDERSEFLHGKGCNSCANSGYRGRIGIFEVLRMTEGIRGMLLSGANAAELRTQAIKDGMIPLGKDGMLKVKANITTLAEVLRITYSAD
ncbi:MAG: GspE/PulE family protein [Chloroflexota bacterium]